MASKQEKASESQDNPAQQCVIKSFYLKDLSFESPRPIEQVWESVGRPEVTMNIDIDTRHVNEDDYEVILGLTVTAKRDESSEALYLIEIKQGGLFLIKGFDEEQRDAMLHIYCASILYPYAREVVSGMVTRGGYPQLLLSPINFEAFYAQRLKQRQVSIPKADQQAGIE